MEQNPGDFWQNMYLCIISGKSITQEGQIGTWKWSGHVLSDELKGMGERVGGGHGVRMKGKQRERGAERNMNVYS